MLDDGFGRDARVQVSPVAEELGERAGDLGRAADPRRDAEPVDVIPQRALGKTGLPAKTIARTLCSGTSL